MTIPHDSHVQRQQDELRSQANQQDIAIAQLNTSIVSLTETVNKLIDRIDKRIEESDRWRREQDIRMGDQNSRLVAVEVVTQRLEKLFWLMGTAVATAGVTSVIGLILHLMDK